MSDKQQALLEWVQGVSWGQYMSDKEVQVIVAQLKDRIDMLSEKGSSSGSGGGQPTHRVKLVAVGDGAVGKTSLLIAYATGKFDPKYVPTVFENHTKQVKRDADNSIVILQLWDTAGQEDYDRLRPLSYPGADVVLLCFSTVTRSSFESVKEKWHPEVAHYVPDALTILVGTKIDLREAGEPDPATKEHDPVSTQEGEAMRKSIRATKYLEASSKTRQNLEETFEIAVSLVLDHRKESEAPTTQAAGNAHADGEDVPASGSPRRKPRRGCMLL